MYTLVYTNRMKRDLKLMKKRGKDISKLKAVLVQLTEGKPLPPKNRDHQLVGRLKKFRECHIEPDWLLLYYIDHNLLFLFATATGTHADLLDM